MRMEASKVVLSILLLIGHESLADDAPVVDTPLGKLRGFTMTSRSGRTFNAYQGIPYAQPPLGDLRFKAPQPPTPWGEILEARDMPKCLQGSSTNPVGQEDCLYLAVYTHNVQSNAPVLFYIHGGAFLYGDTLSHGPQYLMDEDIVIVGIHYRLNVFGFLSFENSDLPGNMGMKDQVMALKWVQANIHLFGGNPNDVTIIGESAGGASVYHHLVSPMSRGLFHKAISESGASYGSWALPPPGKARTVAERLALSLGCPTQPNQAVPCLLNKDAKEILANAPPGMNFCPVFEPSGSDAFLVGPISQWQHNPVPLIIGMTSAEGLMFTLRHLQDESRLKEAFQSFSRNTASLLDYDLTSSNPGEVTNKILQYYGLDKEITLSDWINYTSTFTDSTFSIPVLDGIASHTGPVYAYYFDYVEDDFIPDWLSDKSLYYGANHVAEMYYIWNMSTPPSPQQPIARINVDFSKQLVQMLTGFVKHGNPTPEQAGFVWQRWTPEEKQFLVVDKQAGLSMKASILDDKYRFWKSLNYRDLYD